ncbi:hypothetical protein OS493_007504 [Desmophyllum pertusum]|uniref:Cyclodipeptide synthase n=1 Tax=Desmophyllum pertusum TaxID=174260 RepID=A0A9X0CV08_9CNID|nr:hypothetical protein OS493_007500 [Desmophyllum pertusum]KAJ7374397.1 hypothetical protein OS493_007501 [Desmophyllum pertusum]KAJ7374398.1 hypothetical protein OS493_007502 [Desmophyllum pertusum]KAJ7374399.1 hypothetical protein OS493_007503 [Desmophyllum pertusum]KAJ7374400.1 hypothetical protein OS493_007504 [Desmophyllum pertusum]
MDVSQVLLNGEKFLQDRRPVILGLSPGNSHYCKREVLERLFDFIARKNSDKALLFIPDKISEHNYRAIGSKKPEKSARTKGNALRNKCNKAIQSSGLCQASYSFIRWTEDVETCHEYNKALADIKDLYEANDEFRDDIRESTEAALRGLKGRGKGGNKKNELAEESAVDLKEGVQYVLKELAFFVAVPSIYENCEEFVFVYHRSWPLLERFVAGCYDGIEKPSLGVFVFNNTIKSD